jgi:hypothetical protein
LVGENFEVSVDADGTTFLYPQGDRSALPSGRLPKNGHYFDQISRQEEYDEDELDARGDYEEQFVLFDDETLRNYEECCNDYYRYTDMGIVINAEINALGAATQVIGPMLKRATGIRDLAEWLMAHSLYPEYMTEVFDFQSEMAIKNLKLLKQAVGDKPQVIFLSSTDFGTQQGLLISRDMFRKLYMPYYKRVNDWVHQNTPWKVLFHSCGSVSELMDSFVECGVDCLNPIQCDAVGMDPVILKNKYRSKMVFWGGTVDSQSTIMNGTPNDVRRQVNERIEIFSKGGGFVSAIVHNIQSNVPIENVKAVFDTVKKYR